MEAIDLGFLHDKENRDAKEPGNRDTWMLLWSWQDITFDNLNHFSIMIFTLYNTEDAVGRKSIKKPSGQAREIFFNLTDTSRSQMKHRLGVG